MIIHPLSLSHNESPWLNNVKEKQDKRMQSYSQRHNDDINEDVFDDDTNHQLNNSSSDIKLRRTSNE
jgi:hypothetical protein